jgi:UTP:GlnB (protein PII) uridylyltransferase
MAQKGPLSGRAACARPPSTTAYSPITLALFRARVQIVASRADTKDGYAADRFTIAESDGARLSPQRRGEVRAAVHTALDAFANRAR